MSWELQKLTQKEFFELNNKLKFKSYLNFPDYLNIYETLGWSTQMLIYKKDRDLLSFCNILIKSKFGIKLFYIPGGIEGYIDQNVINDLIKFINNNFKNKLIIFFNFHNKYNINKTFPNSLIKIFNLHETRMVMKKKFTKYENEDYKYSKNWRHNLNRSNKKIFSIEKISNPNIDEIIEVYNEMSQIKKYKNTVTSNFLKLIFENLKRNLIYYESRIDGKLIAFRCVYYNHKSAWDLLAGSNNLSKKNYCTYKIMDSIFNDLKEKNIVYFDFSGVDKINNIGVYNFKKGAGSVEFLKYGEYVYSNFAILKYCFLFFIFLKRIFIK